MRFLDDFKFRRATETNTTSQTKETNRSDSQSSVTVRSESEVREVPPVTNTPCENKKRKAKNTEEPSENVLEYLKKKNEQK